MPRGLREKLAGVSESAGGFADIEPGAYKLEITRMEPLERQEYVRMYWDVAEGPSKGAYANSQYPPSEVLSWKDSALKMLKYKLRRIYQCNPQRLHQTLDAAGAFASVREFDDDDFRAFVGCRFGAVVHRRLYTAGPRSKTPGADRTAVEIALFLTPEEYRDGSWPKRLLEDNDQRDKGAQPAQQVAQVPESYQPVDTLADEDIPF